MGRGVVGRGACGSRVVGEGVEGAMKEIPIIIWSF